MAAQALGGDIPKGNDQIGFPSVYESVFSAARLPERYFVAPKMVQFEEPFVGTDFQSKYHQNKKADADHMARAKVQSTQRGNVRAFSSAHGYFGMPKAVLGQRKFANPSMGAFSATSARRDQPENDAPFNTVESVYTGGVLRSAQGQAYGKTRLLARIGQLNTIEAAKQAFQLATMGQTAATAMPGAPMAPSGMPSAAAATTTAGPAEVGESTKIELNLLFQGIIDALMSGQPRPGDYGEAQADVLSRFTFADATRALTILFRMAPTMSVEDYEDILEKVQNIRSLLDSLLDPDRVEQQPEAVQTSLSMKVLFDKVADYLEKMMEGNNPNLSVQNRLLLSQALVKSLGFSQFLRRPDLQRLAQTAPSVGERASAMDSESEFRPDGGFDRRARPREDDEEEDRGFEDFDGDERQTFGYDSGRWFGEANDEAYSVNPFSREARGRNVAFPGGEAVAADVPSLASSQRTVSSLPISATREDPAAGLRAVFDEALDGWDVSAARPASRAPTRALTDAGRSGVSSSERSRAESLASSAAAATSGAPLAGRPVSVGKPGGGPSEAEAAAELRSITSSRANEMVRGKTTIKISELKPFKPESKKRILKAYTTQAKAAKAAAPAPAPAVEGLSISRADIPYASAKGAREYFVQLARKINALPPEKRPTKDKGTIFIYEGSKTTNVRANFIKRLFG